MRNLLNFLARYNNLIIFLILEGIAFYLLSTGNDYHNTRVVNSIRGLTAGIETKINNVRNYLNLKEINAKLAEENASLKNYSPMFGEGSDTVFYPVTDSVYRQQYVYTTAEVISNSVNRQKNFFTVDRGEHQGVTVDMAVISGHSIAGVIVGCSGNYSRAMSVLNLDFRLSARIKRTGYFGSLSWDGQDVSRGILSEIPQHVSVNVGDTIETTGYSAVFPEGIPIGTIIDYKKPGSDFYHIAVLFITDFRKLHFVEVIGNMKKEEQLELENLFQ